LVLAAALPSLLLILLAAQASWLRAALQFYLST
jgi:hypothetical protein